MEMLPMGVIDPAEAHKRVLEAAGIADREKLVPEPDPQQQAVAEATAKMVEALQMKLLETEVAQKTADIGKTISETQENRAEAIAELVKAQAEQEDVRVERMLRLLEILTQSRQGNEAGRTGSVAGKSANGGASAKSEKAGGSAPTPSTGEVLDFGREIGIEPPVRSGA